ncbi:MAG: glycosyltransferase, partial [Thermoleophilia bacterium]|nr:glycosyltransferase [Thermoleophilia bacterium]
MNHVHKTVTVAVIARNEEATVGGVIESVKPYADEVILVDGNSTDKTRDIAESMDVVSHRDAGKGKGDGIRKAIEAAAGDV